MTWKPGWPGLVARTAAGIGALVIGAAGERDRPPRDPRVSAQASAAAASIWIEGEAAEATTFNRHGWYCCDGVRSDLLSPGVPGSAPGDWLSHYANNDAREVTATYRFEVTAAGRRVLWLRASVYQVRSWWRLDDGPAVDVDLATEARERLNLVAPAIDMVERNGGNWREAVDVTGVDADFYIFRDRSTDAYLPWDVIDGGMKQSFFRSELDKSTRAEWTLPPKRQQENAKLLPVLS